MEQTLKRYAELIIKVGVNLQKGEDLVINATTDSAFFARFVAEKGYEAGAKSVTVYWSDEPLSKMKLQNESLDTLTDFPEWLIKSREYIVDKKAAYVAILAEDPEIYKDIPPEKVAAVSRARRQAYKRFYEASMSNEIRWSLVAIPNLAWAKKVSPNLKDEEAVRYLWSLIFKTMRLDKQDSVKAWREHQDRLKSLCKIMTEKEFRLLKYKNSLGTDFSIGLPKGYYFTGGCETGRDGVEFSANMPTEEIFTAPDRRTANGKVVASMPLFYNGNRIEDFYFVFKDGKVTEYDAKIGKNILKELLATDEGSSYLGEVALVEYDSPIQNLKTLFYNTLFDENASCHLALGKAYPCITGSEKMTKEDLSSLGLNESLEHVDFMLGTPDLSIIGIDKAGKETIIFKDGNFAI
jgi:aminopeptidase